MWRLGAAPRSLCACSGVVYVRVGAGEPTDCMCATLPRSRRKTGGIFVCFTIGSRHIALTNVLPQARDQCVELLQAIVAATNMRMMVPTLAWWLAESNAELVARRDGDRWVRDYGGCD